MKKLSRREEVLARSRAADAARMEALKESDGAGDMVDTVEDEEITEEVSETSEVTDEKSDDEAGE